MPQMSELKRENIIRAAKAKFDAGQEIIALAMAPPSSTAAEAESRSIKRALARAAYREAEVELERLIHGSGDRQGVLSLKDTGKGYYLLALDGNILPGQTACAGKRRGADLIHVHVIFEVNCDVAKLLAESADKGISLCVNYKEEK